MGRLIVSMNLSLDGYIDAKGQDDGSWLRIDEEVHRVFNELVAGADAFLYGRKVYEVMIPYWPDAAKDAAKPAYEREYVRLWLEKPKVVVSTFLKETGRNTRAVSTRLARRGCAPEAGVEGLPPVLRRRSACVGATGTWAGR
jgi:dihydrofolate reductase